MKILLSPVRCDERIRANVSGDAIVINGKTFDFSSLEESCELPLGSVGSLFICSNVIRIDGEISLTLMLPHGQNAPHETRFPAAFTEPMTITSGPVPLPPYDADDKEVA